MIDNIKRYLKLGLAVVASVFYLMIKSKNKKIDKLEKDNAVKQKKIDIDEAMTAAEVVARERAIIEKEKNDGVDWRDKI